MYFEYPLYYDVEDGAHYAPNDEPVTPEYTLGDVDGNGKVDADDYILLKRVYFGQAKL